MRVPVTIKRLFARRAVVLIEGTALLRTVSLRSIIKPKTMVHEKASVEVRK